MASEKSRVRAVVSGKIRATPPDARQSLDRALCVRLQDVLAGHSGKLVLAFSPLPDEPDIMPALRSWLDAGGRLALPVWSGERDLSFRMIGDLDRDLRPGRAGILEPAPSLAEAETGCPAVALTPGRAFSERRQRLGRGAGCYDHLFFRRKLIKIGVCYEVQIFPDIPCDGRDALMDLVLTPERVV